ncbi:sorbitol dehydrogenase 2 [Coccidioides immitis RMSCC 3703]|uniref:D-xylulose reductase n=1 Tax=Coccidioides immitis RMSCC 3703 TaxID=454286 RepID=A0A0J8QJL3_COCIT|nr:sorbitol dehydrogenase 2 [Coccidioides immitis RMSCC 3703]
MGAKGIQRARGANRYTWKNPVICPRGRQEGQVRRPPGPTIQHPHDVMINVKYTGVCGSDVHYWDHGAIGHLVLKEPMVLGHESSGIVISVGPGVRSLKPGDRVALEPGVPCRQCEACKGGKYNLCDDMRFAADAAQGGVKPGDQVVVFGAGPVGLLCCAVARAFGASKVIAVDVQQVRFHFARKYAATATFMPGSIPAAENAQKAEGAVWLRSWCGCCA